MRFQINANVDNGIIEIIDFDNEEVTYLTEDKNPAETVLHLFYSTFDFKEAMTASFIQSETVYTEYINGFTINTEIKPCSRYEQKMYHNYDAFSFDSVIDFWCEVYKAS